MTARTLALWALVLCLAGITNYAWESVHLPLYHPAAGLSGPLPLPLYATLGDMLYTLGALIVVALFRRDTAWVERVGRSDAAGLAILGLGIGFLVEYKGLALHRWTYTTAMPLFFGAGISPILQGMLLLPFSVWFVSLLVRRLPHSAFWTRTILAAAIVLSVILVASILVFDYRTAKAPQPALTAPEPASRSISVPLSPSANDFNQVGNLARNNPGLSAGIWYLVYEQPNQPALTIALKFDAQSVCAGAESTGACDPSAFPQGMRVLVEGERTGQAVLVRRMSAQ